MMLDDAVPPRRVAQVRCALATNKKVNCMPSIGSPRANFVSCRAEGGGPGYHGHCVRDMWYPCVDRKRRPPPHLHPP